MEATRILIVEDEGVVALDIKNRLESFGYVVSDIVPSGEEAIEKTSAQIPDLVLMDIKLCGDMDGIAAAEEIQKRVNIPIVYLTAYSEEKTLQRARITEPYGYILKPYNERELLISIEIALYKHKADAEKQKLVSELEEALAKVKTLSGMLPICASCKKIRDDKGYWNELESYISEHSEVLFSHAICPECGKKLYPQYYNEVWGKEDN